MLARLLTLVSIAAVAATVPGCNCSDGTDAIACAANDECPDDNDCIDGYCRARCTTDDDCAGDARCLEGGHCEVRAPSDGCEGDDCEDGEAKDCDGNPCACDPFCETDDVGAGTDTPFDPDEADADGVGLDDEGALVLDSERINTDFIWIANTPEGTVSKFDTDTYEELGRYVTGPGGGGDGSEVGHWNGNDPSRTSVNTLGDVYVANRNGNSITRISVLGEDCADADHGPHDPVPPDGVVTTSTGGTDVHAWGEDDCVMWHRNLDDIFPGENRVRAVAAQDVEGLDGRLEQYVWVGGYNTRMLAKLDGRTGEVLITTDSPVRTYGFALDAERQLWISTREGNWVGRLDTTRCTDDASCAVEVCSADAESDECDDAVKAQVGTPALPYGITVDFEQRVWLGGSDVMRYDPDADPGDRWNTSGVGFGGIAVHGIAADAEGWVWGAASGNGIVRIDADDPSRWEVVAGTEDTPNKGMAVDADGKIWSITQEDRAVVIMPGPAMGAASVDLDVARSINDPYTYSDMTGLQLRLATNPRGYYRHVVEGCSDDSTPEWGQLRWEAETPPGTSVSFRVRTAETRAGLAAAEWVTIATQPPDAPPAHIGDALDDRGISPGNVLMVEIVLRSERSDDPDRIVTPRVLSINADRSCPPVLE